MAQAKPKLRVRAFTTSDIGTSSPISITPNDVFASPQVRIKSYYDRRWKEELDKKDAQPVCPNAAMPNDRVAMIVHAAGHNSANNESVFRDGKFDWSGRGNHVDFSPDETVILEQAEVLGHRADSSVYRTTCKKIPLAWKKIRCRQPLVLAQRKKIEEIKQLDHHHVMRLVGTYTSESFLGVLMWPVARCDLHALMDDLDHYLDPNSLVQELDLQGIERGARLDTIMGDGMTSSVQRSAILPLLQRRLLRCFGCLAAALAYLHSQGIRHKNLKPLNVLLSFNGLWLTDFETSTDTSENLCTATRGDGRDTSRYIAPDIMVLGPSGMAADIFSLGAMFLEMITLCDNMRLHVVHDLCPDGDHSFQLNISYKQEWFDTFTPTTRQTDGDLLKLISEMLLYDPIERPTAKEVASRLSCYTLDLAQHPREGTYSLRYYDTCCRHIYLGPKEDYYKDTQWTRHQAPPKAEWLIRKQDKKGFDALFNKIDSERNGVINQKQVMKSFAIWGLPDDTLFKIWKLAAIQHGDNLDRDEFAVAMFLIRSQMGAVKHLPNKIPPKLIPPSLRPELHLKDDAPRGYLYNCPQPDCPFKLDNGLTGPDQLQQHLAVFHVELSARRRADSLKKMGRLSPLGDNGPQRAPPRLSDSRARMEDAMKGRGREEPTRLSLMEQARVRKRGATISEMEALREVSD
ncbi:kinase-like protein [Venturia nashicola]|nr:kinase-like protein [Venturia nashicola]